MNRASMICRIMPGNLIFMYLESHKERVGQGRKSLNPMQEIRKTRAEIPEIKRKKSKKPKAYSLKNVLISPYSPRW